MYVKVAALILEQQKLNEKRKQKSCFIPKIINRDQRNKTNLVQFSKRQQLKN